MIKRKICTIIGPRKGWLLERKGGEMMDNRGALIAMGGGVDLLKLDDALATVDDFVAQTLGL